MDKKFALPLFFVLPYKYSIKSDLLIGLGLTLLINKKMNSAIEVPGFAVSEFPDSAMLFSSPGAVYLIAGKKQLAIKNLKKCLELNPNNRDAKRKLKQLE